MSPSVGKYLDRLDDADADADIISRRVTIHNVATLYLVP